ncbi:hypothetical protein [Halorussus salinus]|uniref:hypothetical protein n=1 Tax=Halorussus salinus TaxID=1364935 RepID=UPI0010919C9B|nr:hypothetical protein [Halorussus salinus]
MSDYRERIERLAERAREERRTFDSPADSADPSDDERADRPEERADRLEERAVGYCRDGVGEVVAVYVEARTGEYAPLDRAEMSALEQATNDWLELYARCHGREITAEFTVREVAETVVETRDVVETARLLTGVPERDRSVAWGGARETVK